MKKIGLETLWGGIFGIISILAAIAEAVFNGLSPAAVAGSVKDMAAMLVTVMIFMLAIRSLIPKKVDMGITEKIIQALDSWQKSNSTMILKSDDDDKTGKYGFNMRTDVRNFYHTTPQSKNAGWFVRLPLPAEDNYTKEGIKLEFHLNKGTFFDGLKAKEDVIGAKFIELNDLICRFINAKYDKTLAAVGRNDLITIKFNEPIQTEEDIAHLTDVLNSMFQAYLVSANIRLGQSEKHQEPVSG